ncbi:MAG: FMN-binding protein [Planctomycetota bacterium]
MKLQTDSPTYVVIYTALVSAAFTAAIMVLNAAARPAVEKNEKLFTQKALVDILFEDPQAENLPAAPEKMTEDQIVETYSSRIYETAIPGPEGAGPIQLYVAYSENLKKTDGQVTAIPAPDKIVGYAIRVNGVGFWEPISGYLALSADLTTSRGIVFVKQGETPGLGAKITEQPFRSQWAPDRELKLGPGQTDQFVYIDQNDPTSPEAPAYGRHVDAITGATQTSIAVEKFVNKDLSAFYAAAKDAQLVEKGPPAPRAGADVDEELNPTPPAGMYDADPTEDPILDE